MSTLTYTQLRVRRDYLQLLSERKHDAFMRWKKSGYRDFAAHDTFIKAYIQMMKVAHKEVTR